MARGRVEAGGWFGASVTTLAVLAFGVGMCWVAAFLYSSEGGHTRPCHRRPVGGSADAGTGRSLRTCWSCRGGRVYFPDVAVGIDGLGGQTRAPVAPYLRRRLVSSAASSQFGRLGQRRVDPRPNRTLARPHRPRCRPPVRKRVVAGAPARPLVRTRATPAGILLLIVHPRTDMGRGPTGRRENRGSLGDQGSHRLPAPEPIGARREYRSLSGRRTAAPRAR